MGYRQRMREIRSQIKALLREVETGCYDAEDPEYIDIRNALCKADNALGDALVEV